MASWREQPGLDRLTAALGAEAELCRFVGGAVRDTLLGHAAADLDVATSLPPDEVMRRIGAAGLKAVPTGLAHGTVTAVLPDGPVEVTTLRRDVETDGRHARVAFTDNWREDAARRDFTINALSAEPLSGAVHDYFAGLDDLAKGRVRFIGEAQARIAEDHLRILRFFRFHARFGQGPADDEALAACAARARDLQSLSRERIAQELLKLLAVADPVPTLALMVGQAILAPVLPEIGPEGMARLAQLTAREAALAEADPIRRLAALLPLDPTLVDAVAARLRLSKAQRRRLVAAAAGAPGEDARLLAYGVGIETARDRLLLHASEAALAEGWERLTGWVSPRLSLTGGDLIALGLPRGPIVAATLAMVEQRWAIEGFPPPDRTRSIAAEAVAQALGRDR